MPVRELSRAHNTKNDAPSRIFKRLPKLPETDHPLAQLQCMSLERLKVAFDCHLHTASTTVSAVLYESGDALVAGSALVLTAHGGGVVLE